MYAKAIEILKKNNAVTDGLPDPFLEADLRGSKKERLALVKELEENGYSVLVANDRKSVIIAPRNNVATG